MWKFEVLAKNALHLGDGAFLGTSLEGADGIDLHRVIVVDINQVFEAVSQLLSDCVMAFGTFFG